VLACENWGIQPDIAAFGKGMGAGYAPIAAAVVSDKIMEPIMEGSKSIMSGHTLSANPQSCAVSLAVLEYLEKRQIIPEVGRKGEYLCDHLRRLEKKYSFIGDIRGKGLLLGIELVKDKAGKDPFGRCLMAAQKLVSAAQEQGILLYPAGSGIDGIHGDAVILAPPLNITLEELDELAALFDQALSAFQRIIEQESLKGGGS
jgi:adenosylmethionine-8-amino-7-oxononanoate aminotransferase